MSVKLKYNCEDFLKNSELSWIKYKLDKSPESKKELIKDKFISGLIDECLDWPNMTLKRHNDAKHLIHKVCLLVDLGLSYEDNGIKEIAEKILSNQIDDGAIVTMQNIPTNFGGSGADELHWIICDFPVLLYILLKLGLKQDKRVAKSIAFLKSISSEVGWKCVSDIEKFGGPGRKADYCPVGTLISLKAFSLLPEYHDSEYVKAGIDSILHQWKHQGERKIRMFGIGTDFRKLKYPNIWFDIVHVVRVLSEFKYARNKDEFNEMLSIIADKQQESGGFIPESVYMAYKPQDFSQKKVESETLTYEIYSIFNRINES